MTDAVEPESKRLIERALSTAELLLLELLVSRAARASAFNDQVAHSSVV